MDFFQKILLISKRTRKRSLDRGLNSYVQVDCEKEYLGTEYGGWSVCPNGLTKESIVYSFGVGEDISFDLAMIERFGMHIYAFDPTPKSINWVKSQRLPKEFQLFEFGVAGYDGTAKFYPPENPEHVSCTILEKPSTANKAIEVKVYKLSTIMNMLGHKRVDILKMDIEGAEYAVIDELLSLDIEIQQLLVEFHHRFANIGIAQTRKTIESLNRKGYKIFHVSPSGEEYSFIRS